MTQETKNIKINSATSNFKDKGESLIKKVIIVKKLIRMMHISKKFIETPSDFFIYIKEMIGKYDN
jgi:hypothetical protein